MRCASFSAGMITVAQEANYRRGRAREPVPALVSGSAAALATALTGMPAARLRKKSRQDNLKNHREIAVIKSSSTRGSGFKARDTHTRPIFTMRYIPRRLQEQPRNRCDLHQTID